LGKNYVEHSLRANRKQKGAFVSGSGARYMPKKRNRGLIAGEGGGWAKEGARPSLQELQTTIL